jgi:streptogramin lyase
MRALWIGTGIAAAMAPIFAACFGNSTSGGSGSPDSGPLSSIDATMPNGATDGGGAEGPTDDGAPAVADAALDGADGGLRADAGSIVEFASCSVQSNIATGQDKNLWFTCPTGIGRMTTAGAFTTFAVGDGGGAFFPWIASGSDGNLWFTAYTNSTSGSGAIGRITPSGVVTEFLLRPGSSVPGPLPWSIASGPDGNLWFTEYLRQAQSIGRITTSGVITEFPVPWAPSNTLQDPITSGPDGNLWFTSTGQSALGRITTSGAITEFPDPFSAAATVSPNIVSGPDGNLWFTGVGGYVDAGAFVPLGIGRITTSGMIAGIPTGVPQGQTVGITVGADGNFWFTDESAIYKMTPMGAVTKVFPGGTVPLAGGPPGGAALALPLQITSGPDNNLWFTNLQSSQIGRLTL